MKKQIEKFISRIEKDPIVSYALYTPAMEKFTFTGDGAGDFAERAEEATLEVIENYVKYCEQQIELAKEYYNKKGYELDGALNIALKLHSQRIEPWYPDLDNTTNLCIKMVNHIAHSPHTGKLTFSKVKEHLSQFFPEDVIEKAIDRITQ